MTITMTRTQQIEAKLKAHLEATRVEYNRAADHFTCLNLNPKMRKTSFLEEARTAVRKASADWWRAYRDHRNFEKLHTSN